MTQGGSLLEKCNEWLREKSAQTHYKLTHRQEDTDDYILLTSIVSTLAVGVTAAVEPQLLIDAYQTIADTIPESADQFMRENRILLNPSTYVEGLELAMENLPEAERSSLVGQIGAVGLPGAMASMTIYPLGRAVRYGLQKSSGALHDYLK